MALNPVLVLLGAALGLTIVWFILFGGPAFAPVLFYL